MVSESEDLLIHNALNEALHGLPETHSVQKLLLQKKKLEQIADEWARKPCQDLIAAHRETIIECVRTVLGELGEAEFETRIGVDVRIAQVFLKRICNSSD